MKNKKLASLLACSLLAFNINVMGSSQAQAAACSAKDKYNWSHNADDGKNKPNMEGLYAMAGFMGSDEYVGAIFDLLESWKKATKSKKLKAALIKFETQFEIHGASGIKYSYIPELKKEYNALATIFKFNRC